MARINNNEIEGYIDEEFTRSYISGHYNYFKNYCDACDNFKTRNCPFKRIVTENTRWQDLNCTNFTD